MKLCPNYLARYGFCLLAIALSGNGQKTFAASKPAAAPDSLARDIALDHYLTGSISEEAGELWRAVVEYQVAYLYDPGSIPIAIALAEIYQKLGYPEAALKILEAARALNPGEPALIRPMIPLLVRSDRLPEAVQCFELLKEKGELGQEEMLRYAGLLQSQQDFNGALRVYRDYIARFGGSAELYERIGVLHLNRQNIAAAETCFVRLLELDSTAQRVLFLLGNLSAAREDWETAEGYFRRSLAGDSSNFRTWINLLQTLIEQRRYEECEKISGSALAAFPDNAELYYINGSMLERLKRYDEALAALQKSVALDSTKTPPHLSLGFIYQQLGRWEDAAETYDRIMAQDADNPVLLNNYAYMLSEWNNRLDEALQFVNLALKARPATASFMDTRGWIYYRMGRYQEAYQDVKQAMKGETDNAELFYHLGEILRAMGKEGKAREAFQRAAEMEPDNEQYRQLAR